MQIVAVLRTHASMSLQLLERLTPQYVLQCIYTCKTLRTMAKTRKINISDHLLNGSIKYSVIFSRRMQPIVLTSPIVRLGLFQLA